MKNIRIGFAWLSIVLAFVFFLVILSDAAEFPASEMLRTIEKAEKANLDTADSAPQQTVAMLWTLRDYSTALVMQNMHLAGLLRLLGALLILININLGLWVVSMYSRAPEIPG